MPSSNIKVLLLSKDAAAQAAIGTALGGDYEISKERHEEGALAQLSRRESDVVVFDYSSWQSPFQDCLKIVLQCLEQGSPVVVMADDADRSASFQLVEHGANGQVRKPPHLTELKNAIGAAFKNTDLQRQLERPWAAPMDQLVGSSAAMRRVFDMIRRVADLDVSIVIRGESGTGKELVARAIHNLGRKGKPFEAVSLGAVPEALVEAELFGHERGAFTGADRSREGYFEAAADGTLLLDEIGEVSTHTQVKLLRVLQERRYSRIGTNKTGELRARILFATHRNLEEMVQSGEFREDLYYRMHVVKIEVPPLRERLEDLAPLGSFFLARYSEQYGTPAERLSGEALRLLLQHDWPGNVRELENVIQRVAILSEEEEVGTDCIEEALHLEPQDVSSPSDVQIPGEGSFEEQIQELKIQVVLQALAHSDGNKTVAAQRLGITRSYLHRILRRSAAKTGGVSDRGGDRIA